MQFSTIYSNLERVQNTSEQLLPPEKPLSVKGLTVNCVLAELCTYPFYEAVEALYKSPNRKDYFMTERKDILEHIKMFFPKADDAVITTTFIFLWQCAARRNTKDTRDS